MQGFHTAKEKELEKNMDDGYSPWSLLLLLVIIVLEIVFYGFGEAVQKLNT